MTSIDEVIAVSCQCMTCKHKFTKKYDPPITWELYTEYRDRRDSDAFLCEKCNTPCPAIAYFKEAEAVVVVEQPANATNGSASTKVDKKKKPLYLQRVSNDECFAEAVLIDKIPKFLIVNNGTGEVSVVDFIPLGKEDKIASPLASESYINKTYTFNSQLELDAIIEEARKQTLDRLYRMVRRIWKRYVDADDFHISICAADTIFTYFQDKAGMTHYLFWVRVSRITWKYFTSWPTEI